MIRINLLDKQDEKPDRLWIWAILGIVAMFCLYVASLWFAVHFGG